MTKSLQVSRANVVARTRAARGKWIARTAHRMFAMFAWTAVLMVTISLSWLTGASTARAEDVSNATMQSLDEQVQEIKSDVLGIAAELTQLEEKLLYPSDTQMAVFVSLADEDESRLDSVEILLDGEPVARHIYSWKELEALQRGGVQRIYTGNLETGTHQLDVVVAGKTAGGRTFDGAESFRIEKSVAPKWVEVELASGEFGKPQIRIGED